MNLCEQAIEILEKTHDGNDLCPSHLKMIENAINGFLSEEGIKAFNELHHQTIIYGYKKPWFHGVEHVTLDNDWYVYWKGIRVEHYSLNVPSIDWTKTAEEFASICKDMEAKGIEVNAQNYLKYCWEKS